MQVNEDFMLQLQASKNKVVGSNSVLNAIEKNNVIRVFLAKDVDNFLSQSIINAAQTVNIPISFVETREKLARLCNVPVKTATAAILKQ